MTVADATGVVEDQLLQRRLHRRFEDARLPHVAAHAEQLRTAVFLRAKRGKPLRAVRQNRRQVTERLHVVDGGRRVVEARRRGERRLDPRLRALALERFDERGFFTRFVRAGAAMDDDVAVEARAQDVLAGVALGVRLRELRFQNVLDVEELAADVDVGDLRADGPAADQAPFEEQVWIALHQQMIFEGPGLAFVRVAADVFRLRRVLEYELPFEAGWKACAAAAAQARRLDELDDLVRLH